MTRPPVQSALARRLRRATCPACAHHVAVPFLEPSTQPLATLGWPETEKAAKGMMKLPLRFVRCVECGHVFNEAFEYDAVPYTNKPNLMFNQGVAWAGHLKRVMMRLAGSLPEKPVVVEIGHGDGSFLSALAGLKPGGRFVGFDPHGVSTSTEAVEFRAALFEPNAHLAELHPDLIISRHVLEHLTNPLGFMQEIAFAATCLRVAPQLYLEVPCIDRALEIGRTVDFYYEHNSHFTSESFERMLERCSSDVDLVGHGYDREVIFGLVRLGGVQHQVRRASEAARLRNDAQAGLTRIKSQLAEMHERGMRVAVWGGTGKAAAFINRYGLDAKRFPVVVDSDPEKVGTFVPGMGQEIRFRDWLLEHPVHVVLIPSQWRAADITDEMRSAGIRAETVLIEHDGRLVDFGREPHPYVTTHVA